MSFMSEYVYSEEDLLDEINKEKERIREEVRQAIENGVLKIECGTEKLFRILE